MDQTFMDIFLTKNMAKMRFLWKTVKIATIVANKFSSRKIKNFILIK